LAPRYWTGNVPGLPLDSGIQLRKAMEDEVTGGFADVSGNHRRFLGEPIALEPQRVDAVVVRPHGAILIRVVLDRFR
jgi:hypothetical protein